MKKPPKDLGRRTTGEKLWLRRKAIGLTAYAAAAEAGVGRGRYGEAEKDRDPALAARLAAVLAVFEPSLALLLALARRRSGKGLEAAARSLRLSRVAFLAAERRGDPRVVAHWRAKGFRFPRDLVH